MRTLPEMTIFNPCDAFSAALVARYCFDCTEPVYVRLDKGELRRFYSVGDSPTWKLLVGGNDVCIVSTGFFADLACKLAMSFNFASIDVCRLKPIPEDLIQVLKQYRQVICIEENALTGGMGSSLLESGINVTRYGLPNNQLLCYGSRNWFHGQFGLNETAMKLALGDLCS
jgi:transketolase C-terminal domain/subunit